MADSVQLVPPPHTTTPWTLRFAGLFAAVALVGGLAAFLGSTARISLPVVGSFVSVGVATSVIYAGLVIVCLTGI
jgi:hypothetical protein